MALSVVQKGQGNGTNANCTITLGAAPTSGDLLVAIVRGANALTVGSGYATLQSTTNAQLNTKTAGGSELAGQVTATQTAAKYDGYIYEISGQSGATPVSTKAAPVSNTISLSASVPNSETGWLAFIFVVGSAPSSPTASTPTGFTQDYFGNDGTNVIAAYSTTSTVSGTVNLSLSISGMSNGEGFLILVPVAQSASITGTASATIKASGSVTSSASATVRASASQTAAASADIQKSGSQTSAASATVKTSGSKTSGATATVVSPGSVASGASADIHGNGVALSYGASAYIERPLALTPISQLDVRITVWNPAKSVILVEDCVSTGDLAGGAVKYEDTPSGCGAGELTLGLRLEEARARGYWAGMNIVEISTADNILQSSLVQNLVPCSDLLVNDASSGWTDTSSGALVWSNNAAPGGKEGGFTATGTGAAVSGKQYSPSFTVTGAVKFSGYIKPTYCSGNTPRILIMDPTLTTTYATLNATNGAAGQQLTATATFASPTTVVYVFDANGTTLASGQPLIFALPLLTEQTQLANGHYISSAAAGVAYLDTIWTFDPAQGEDGQQAYFWDGATLTMLCPVTKVGTDATGPYIEVGQSLAGGLMGSYAAGTLVGRRRYTGRIVRRSQTNDYQPNGTVTLVGMAKALDQAYGTFAVGAAANVDTGTVIYQTLLQLSPGHWPFFTLDPSNFPTVGSIYSGSKTDYSATQQIADCLNSIPTGDVWTLRVGHDLVPRLIKLYDSTSNTYTYNVTLDQHAAMFVPVAVQIDDEDVSGLYNALKATGDQDPTTKQPVSAIVDDPDSIEFYGFQIDGQPVNNLGCKTSPDCANYATGLLNQFSIARSNQQFQVFTRNDQLYNIPANVGGVTQGDVVRAIANTTVAGFENENTTSPATTNEPVPPIYGLGTSVQTVIDFDKLDRSQLVQFSAVEPDWSTALREKANALSNAFSGSGFLTGLDQYFVDSNAFNGVTWSGLVVSTPKFYAVFTLGTNPVFCGGSSAFTVGGGTVDTSTTHGITGSSSAQTVPVVSSSGLGTGSFVGIDAGANYELVEVISAPDGTHIRGIFTKNHANGVPVQQGPMVSYVWLNPDTTWTVKANDPTVVSGAILYAIFTSHSGAIVGYQQKAAIGFISVPGSYFIGGSQYTPTFTTGSPTISNKGQIAAQISIAFEVTNQPQDGSYAKMVYVYRQHGQPDWLELGQDLPRDASSSPGAVLQNGVVSANGKYVLNFPDAANGIAYDFGFAMQSGGQAQTDIETLASNFVSSDSPPNTASLSVTWGTPTVLSPSGATTIILGFSVSYSFSGVSGDVSWLGQFQIAIYNGDPLNPLPTPVSVLPAQRTSTSGTLNFQVQLPSNWTNLAGHAAWNYLIAVWAIGIDTSSVLSSNDYTYQNNYP
jgi:hypothetical protein